MQKTNEVYYRQITLFELLCRDGNVLVTLKEMNANDMVRKLQLIEKNPLAVWQAIESQYGYGFFLKVISEEFGITPDFQTNLQKEMASELSRAKTDANNKLQKLSVEAKKEIGKLLAELREGNADRGKQREKYLQQVEMAKDEMRFGIQKENARLIGELET